MKNNYSYEYSMQKYQLLVDDMFYNILTNLIENKMSLNDLAEELGITYKELEILLINDKKDFFVALESISILEKKKIYKNHSRLKLDKSSQNKKRY